MYQAGMAMLDREVGQREALKKKQQPRWPVHSLHSTTTTTTSSSSKVRKRRAHITYILS